MSADLHERLHRLADQPAPPQRLDIAQAQRSGRRTRQRRRAGAVGGCVVAVAALAAAAVLPWTPANPARPAPALQPAPSRTILAPDASFGWLPAGEHLKTVIVDRQNGAQSFELDTSQITLTTYPSGPEPVLPHFGGGIQAKRLPAASVNGHPAYWLAKPGQSNIIHLRWRYDRAGWADLQLNGTAATLNTRAVYRIADSIIVGKPSPLRFPVRITGLPGSLIPVRMGLREAEVDYNFQVAASPSATAHEQQANWLSITTLTDSPSVRQHLRSQALPNTTINGHPAWDSRIDPAHSTQHQASHGEQVVVYDDHGQILQVNAGPGTLKILAPSGGVPGLIKRITLLPKADWTTTPFN
jgi:hypothetical protein